ncbi:ATPase AAA [Pseudolactococcus yaeyamensis]
MTLKNKNKAIKKPKRVKLTKTEKRKVKRIKANTSPTTQNSLFFHDMNSDGVMSIVDNEYSSTFALGEVTYSTATDDDKIAIISKYNDSINLLSEDEHYQLTILVKNNPRDEYLAETSYPLQNDKQDVLRNELNEVIQDNYDRGRNNIIVSRHITLSTKADSFEAARKKLENISDDFSDELREIDAKFEQLSGDERLKLMNQILRPSKPLYGTFQDIEKGHLTPKDLIAPNYLEFRHSKIDFEMDDKINKIIYLRDYPTNLKDTMLKDLIDTGVEMVLTIHGSPYSIKDTNQRLRDQATDVGMDMINREEKAARRRHSVQHIARSTQEDYKEVNEQIDFVTETGDKQLSSLIMIHLWADTQAELQDNLNKVETAASKHGAVFAPLYLVQEEALNASLPIGKNYVDIESNYLRDLVTPNISINSPFTSADVQHKNGKYYGINLLSRNNILINRNDDSMKNGNGGIVGVSGSGKGMAAKNEMITTYIKNPNDEIIVVDAESEYTPIGIELGAQIISVAPGSNTHINLLDLPKDGELESGDSPIALKSDFLISLFDNLLHGLDPIQKTLIDEVTTEIYQQVAEPSLIDWHNLLKSKPSDEAQALAKALGLYITGSLNMFAKPTNVNLNSRFTIYNIRNLGAEFKSFGFVVLMDRIWNKVVENRAKGIVTWIYFDEFQIVLNPNQMPVLREKAADLYARVRKYGAFPTFMTQSAETVVSTPEGRSIFFNSDFMILLQQKLSVYDLLVEAHKLTPKQASYLRRPPLGGGLIVAGNAIVPFSNIIPKHTELFRIMNTKV